jgi:hypothetical protein
MLPIPAAGATTIYADLITTVVIAGIAPFSGCTLPWPRHLGGGEITVIIKLIY